MTIGITPAIVRYVFIFRMLAQAGWCWAGFLGIGAAERSQCLTPITHYLLRKVIANHYFGNGRSSIIDVSPLEETLGTFIEL